MSKSKKIAILLIFVIFCMEGYRSKYIFIKKNCKNFLIRSLTMFQYLKMAKNTRQFLNTIKVQNKASLSDLYHIE